MEERHCRRNIRLRGYNYNTPGVYFLTLCVKERRCVLARIVRSDVIDSPKVLLLPYGKIADKFIRELSEFYDYLSVDSYVIMPNHIHILLRVLEGNGKVTISTLQNSVVSRFVSTLKRFCNKECGGNIWQPRSYDHIIRDQADYDRHLKYIYENPFGWEKDEFYLTD